MDHLHRADVYSIKDIMTPLIALLEQRETVERMK